MRLNFTSYDHYPELFIQRFKRPYKKWTIEELHDLWVKLKDRNIKRRLEVVNFQNEIAKQIVKNKNGEYIFYYENGRIWKYTMVWHREYNCYGVSSEILNLKSREDKLEFLLLNDIKLFEIGNKYRKLEKMTSRMEYVPREILERMIQDKLEKKFKNSHNIPDIFTIDIDNKKYFIELDEQYRYSYKKFHLKNECNDSHFTL